tara:strand:+ start:1709 stop:3232 length:1524 start_codon:yes stop_codon:yes gene_type:complete
MLRNLLTLVLLAASATAQNYYAASLDSAQEVPANGSAGRGWGIVRNDAGTDLVNVYLRYEGLAAAATAAHVHLGLPGTNGGVVFALTSTGPNTYTGQANIGAALIPALEAGGMYLNLHTAAFGGGEIRGQIVKANAMRFTASLEGGQEVPPVASAGSGTVDALFYEPEDRLVYTVNVANTAGITAAHLHQAAAGSNGPVLTGLTGTNGTYCGVTDRLTPAQKAALLADGLYCNIHTSANPGGEVRGQLRLMNEGQQLVAAADSLQEVPPNPSPGLAGATAVRQADGSVAVTGEFSGLQGTATAAHVHVGAPGSNGPVVFALSIVGNTISGSVTPTPAQAADMQAGNWYINIHTSVVGSGEIRGQLTPATLPTTYGGGCTGSNGDVPQIGATGSAIVGTAMSIDLYGALPNTFALLAFGGSRSSVGGALSLPLELSTFGLSAPNCLLLAAPTLLVANPVDPRGCATLPIAMPFNPALRGGSYFSQWFVLDGANPAGLVASNALEFTIE